VTDVTDVTDKNQKGKSDWISLFSRRAGEAPFFPAELKNNPSLRHIRHDGSYFNVLGVPDAVTDRHPVANVNRGFHQAPVEIQRRKGHARLHSEHAHPPWSIARRGGAAHCAAEPPLRVYAGHRNRKSAMVCAQPVSISTRACTHKSGDAV
jgi:hypothetical protein